MERNDPPQSDSLWWSLIKMVYRAAISGQVAVQHPEEDNEAIDKYLNMELTPGVGTDDERWGRVVK